MQGRVFKKEQTYRGTWVMYLILMLEIPTLIIVSFTVLNTDLTDKHTFIALGIVAGVMALVFGLILNLKLETRIDERSIQYRYFPLVKWRTILKEQIVTADVITFSPLTDHGGWGIKGNKSTQAYTVIGDKGLSLDINQKKKIVIGTQKPKELGEFIKKWLEE